jgi:hypothetical protein
MSPDHISLQRAVYSITGMERAAVRKDLVYRTTEAGPLTMDVNVPASYWSRATTTSATKRCSAAGSRRWRCPSPGDS